MAVNLRLEGAPGLTAALSHAEAVVRAEQLRAMQTALLLVEADARRNVAHDTRALMNSITNRMASRGDTLVGQVGPSVRYGVYVERGTRPHWPPAAPLVGWARRHGVPVVAVQRAIARRGTRARPFLVPAFTKNREKIVALFGVAAQAVTVTIAGVSGALTARRGG